ncbi:hypothetical protein GGI03_002556 [Coemansia sp. RSA 2337]|nr:hypothetical protein GGI14_004761 [Coemansia sp. S680]KAJ2028232.1 hypothetical protein H4S03_007922 [Coemansia sp. S3946]KAJ2111211.1 hypothetical protein IW146_005516 [Coemansia sp. RSA 922]KAJ2465629.1 hypothetical protein GGI03_002556 [Coemansia sp. RSA 2337]
MGVKGLTALLARFAPACISMPAAKDIKGWTIAIDSNIFVQRFFRGSSGKAAERHTTGMRNMAAHARSLDITPVFVFDGNERASGKEAEMQKRRELKSRIRNEHHVEQQRARRIAAMEQVRVSLLDCESADGKLPLDLRHAEFLPRGNANENESVVETIIHGNPDRQTAVAWLADNAARLASSAPVCVKPGGSRRLTVDARINALELEISRILLFRLGAATEEPEGVALDARCTLQTLEQLSSERLATLSRRVESLTPAHIDDCRRLLDSLGFATHTADGHVESEALCAALVRQGVADAACSEDLDVLAFGGQRLLRGFYTLADEMMLIDADIALTELGLTRESFVDLCILCGTDFSATLEKVGPITALKLIRQFGSIERILESDPEIRPRDGFQFKVARDVFLQDVQPPFTDRAQVVPRPASSRLTGLPFDPFAPGVHHPVLQ